MGYSLWVAILCSAASVLSYSAARDVEVNALDRALRSAVLGGTPSDVRKALEQGGDARSSEADGTTLLMRAALRDEAKMVEALLGAGALPDVRNDEDEHALIFAARGCSLKSVEHLLKRRIEINLQNHLGETALMIAAQNGCSPVVRRLLREPGIDLFVRDHWGRSVMASIEANWVIGLDMDSLDRARVVLKKRGASPQSSAQSGGANRANEELNSVAPVLLH